MKYEKRGNVFVVVPAVGDRLHDVLLELQEKEGIEFAHISGIGALGKATLGCYDLSENRYLEKTFEGQMELVSLLGNMTRKDGKPYIHLHAGLCDESCRLIGGHLLEGTVSITGEIFVTVVEGTMGRRFNPANGVNLFDI